MFILVLVMAPYIVDTSYINDENLQSDILKRKFKKEEERR